MKNCYTGVLFVLKKIMKNAFSFITIIIVLLTSGCLGNGKYIKVDTELVGSVKNNKKIHKLYKQFAEVAGKIASEYRKPNKQELMQFERVSGGLEELGLSLDEINDFSEYLNDNPENAIALQKYHKTFIDGCNLFMIQLPKIVYKIEYKYIDLDQIGKTKKLEQTLKDYITFFQEAFDVTITLDNCFRGITNENEFTMFKKPKDSLVGISNLIAIQSGYQDASGYSTAYGEFFLPAKFFEVMRLKVSHLAEKLNNARIDFSDDDKAFFSRLKDYEKNSYYFTATELRIIEQHFSDNPEDNLKSEKFITYINLILEQVSSGFVSAMKEIEEKYSDYSSEDKKALLIRFFKENYGNELLVLNEVFEVSFSFENCFKQE